MLLGNDAIEGSESISLQSAAYVAASLRNNIRRMREQFMLDHLAQGRHTGHGDAMAMGAPMLTIPDEFKNQFSDLLNVYWELQSSLAADDANASASAIKELPSAFAAITATTLDDATKAVWTKEQKQLEQILNRLNSATDITKARAEFALLSEEVSVIVQRFQITADRDIYELHCPMAFDGRGATWLQPNDQVKNPYYGASMLTCADRVRKLESSPHADASEGGHQHE